MKTKQPKKPRNPAMATALAVAGVTGLATTGVKNAAVIDGALHNVDVVVEQSKNTPIVSNPMQYIEELSKMSAFWGDVALRTFTSNIGYYAVGSIMWAFRKRNQMPEVTSNIDAFNGMLADADKKEFDEVVTEMQGNKTLPFIKGEKLIAAYKFLFIECSRNQINPNFDLPNPAAMYARNQKPEADRTETEQAYDSFELERLKNSPTFAHIKAKMEQSKNRDDLRARKKAQTELDHIHTVIRDTEYEPFTDDVWNTIPVWAQYKFALSVYRQCISAVDAEAKLPSEERLHLFDLAKLAETLLLELQMARAHEQVKLAFEKGNLKENHEITI